MDTGIFKKMKVKAGCRGSVFNAPDGYPQYGEITWCCSGAVDFMHLFVSDKAQFTQWFHTAIRDVRPDTLFWLSYRKSTGKQKYDINRDSLWDLVLPEGWHPVSQVSLDETWSAIRLRPNEPGTEYSRPNVKKKPG